jgi:hypothetical protein
MAEAEETFTESMNSEDSQLKPPPIYEMTEALLSSSMLKKKEWTNKYRISDRTVYDLFSEFSGMVMIAKMPKGGEKIKEVLPASEHDKMSKMLKLQMLDKHHQLDQKDMEDFRIPLDIYREYSSIMKGLNRECQNSFLKAIGVEVEYSKSKVTWEAHIQLSCLLRFDNCTM